MTDSTIITIVIVVVAVVVIAAAAYFIAGYLRGKIRLSLPVTGFDAGSTIKGSFGLHAKKPIRGKRLIVSVIGTQRIRRRRGGKTETESFEVYRKEELIEEGRDYPAGYQKVYDFELTAPTREQSVMPDNDIMKTLVSAAHSISGQHSTMRWKLEVRLVAKGIDLVGSKRIYVNGF